MEITTEPVQRAVGNDFVETTEFHMGCVKTDLGYVKTIAWKSDQFFTMSVIVQGTIYSHSVNRLVPVQEALQLIADFVKEVQQYLWINQNTFTD